MTFDILDIIALALAVIGGVFLFILVRRATRGRKRARGKPAPNLSLIMALATFVGVMIIFLFARHWLY